MEEKIEARVPSQVVWEAWERAHLKMEAGQKGISKAEGKSKFRYEILDVKKGERFSILWKTFFVRLIFTHTVKPIRNGSEITYSVQIKGLFAWLVRWFLGDKIKKNIGLVLKTIVRELEQQAKG